MSETPRRSYGGQSADARRLQRRARLLDAAMDAMVDNAWRTITVDKLCAAAGLNKRYFYENFTDLDDVATSAVDDIAAELRDATLTAVAAALAESLERQAHVAVDTVVRTLTADPRRARVLLGSVSSTAAVQQHRDSVLGGLTAVLVGHARMVHDVELESDPLARVAPAFIVGGTADAILAYVNGTTKVSVEDLVESLATLWLVTGNGAAEVARARRDQASPC
ncbi:TetR/AcrR family transcriptional regulator [Mycobacterium neumannii]|uniref:TetR/AcrR family transcriptional regulator n=1 Tax=Mycobacterium neumannii TaxID=2048551 RepID=UPI003AB1A3C7